MEKILLAGPWVGEFGWELFCWQGHIRRLSKDFDKTIIIGREGNDFLYSDFCDEYVVFNPESFKTDMWMCHGAKSHKHLINSIKHTKYFSGNFNIGMLYSIDGVRDLNGLFFKQSFHKYQTTTTMDGYDVILHGRNKSTGSDRNWSKEQWDILAKKLLDEGLNICCIGNSEAFHMDGTTDLRGITLEDLTGVMNKSKIIVGPSSGPMHMASLCGLKHLVWSTEYNRIRYERDWNPFNTEVIFHSDGEWNPNPNDIKNIIINNI
jgi:ADP-heptose:LPS heptosyltransferase